MAHNKVGVGVPSSYRKDANNKVDVLWKVKIKGRKFLADNIPLHMSLRVFDYLDRKDIERVKDKVRELDIRTPDPKNLKFKTTLFHSKHTNRDYFMLKIFGVHDSCDKFFECFRNGYGFSHKTFMPHITIDKALYDSIKKEGLKPEEVEFSALTIEDGANNTVHEFRKSEDLEKSLKHWAAAGAMGLGLIGAPQTARADYTHVDSYVNSLSNKLKDIDPNIKVKTVKAPGIHKGKISFGRFSVQTEAILGGKAGMSHHSVALRIPNDDKSTWSEKDHKDHDLAKIMHNHLSEHMPALMDMTSKNPLPTTKIGKSEDLQKGLKGDWQKEGYRITHRPHELGLEVHAHSPSGEHVGWALFTPGEKGALMPHVVNVKLDHQRKGLASGIYQHAEKISGRPISPSPDQSYESKKLWSQKDRPFGKSEDLQKGLKGDWQKEGYRVEHSFSDKRSPRESAHSHVFRAFDKHGNMVGSLTAHSHPQDQKKLMSAYTHVDDAHQRKGLATAMYRHAEKTLGRKFAPATHQEEPGKKLWGSLGKSESELKYPKHPKFPNLNRIPEHSDHPKHLPVFKQGDKVKLHSGVTNAPSSEENYTVHGRSNKGHDRWVSKEGQPTKNGHYHRIDRMTLEAPVDSDIKKFEEDLQKGIKHTLAGIAAVGAMASAPAQGKISPNTKQQISTLKPATTKESLPYSRANFKRATSGVESAYGTNTNHPVMTDKINFGEKAYGKYGLTPETIRETIRMNHDLKKQHPKAIVLHGDDMHRYLQDNPHLEEQVMDRHLSRLEHHFGPDIHKLSYAWLNGISGTYKAIKNNVNFSDHWRAKRIKNEYVKKDKKEPKYAYNP